MNKYSGLGRRFAFFRDESGAVTVDWVVLTAAVVILSIGVVAGLRDGLNDVLFWTTGIVANAIWIFKDCPNLACLG